MVPTSKFVQNLAKLQKLIIIDALPNRLKIKLERGTPTSLLSAKILEHVFANYLRLK